MSCRKHKQTGQAIGAPAPDFDLPGVDGKRYTLASFKQAKVLVIVFTANHCPTAQAYGHRTMSGDGQMSARPPRRLSTAALLRVGRSRGGGRHEQEQFDIECARMLVRVTVDLPALAEGRDATGVERLVDQPVCLADLLHRADVRRGGCCASRRRPEPNLTLGLPVVEALAKVPSLSPAACRKRARW